MDKLKTYGKAFWWVWSGLSVIVLVAMLVINFGFEKPKTAGYEYFNNISLNFESDEVGSTSALPIFEVNVCTSDTNPDLMLFELVVTEYTDYEQQDYQRYVMQAVGNFGVKYSERTFEDNPQSEPVGKIYFYHIDSNGSVIKQDFEFVDEALDKLDVTSGDISYQLELGGSQGTRKYTQLYYKTKWDKFWSVSSTRTGYAEYNVYDLFVDLTRKFVLNEDFEGYKVFKNLDLDKYFTITRDNGKGQFYSITDFDTNNAYFSVKYTNKKLSTYLTAEHSLIGRIGNDPNYSSGVVNIVTPSYSNSVDFTINNYYISQEYNHDINKYVLTISDDFREYLASLNNLNIVININLDDLDFNYTSKGIDLSSLDSLNVTSLTLNSTVAQDFYILGSNKNIVQYEFSPVLTILNSQGGAWNE